MTTSHKALLIISSISFSLHAMEKQEIITTNNSDNTKLDIQQSLQLSNQNNKQQNYIKAFYQNTDSFIRNYNPQNQRQSAPDLINIITQINFLKSYNITESDLGVFASSQPQSFLYPYISLPPYNGPHYVSALCARLKRYNDHLEKHCFTSPTLKQFNFDKNSKLITTSIKEAAEVGIYIDTPTIDQTVAIDDFKELIKNINDMLRIAPEKIKCISELEYDSKK